MWDQVWEFAVQNIFNVLIIIGIVFLIFGPKKFHKFHIGKEGIEFHGVHETGCGEVQHKHEAQLNRIEKILEDDVQERKTRQDFVDKKLDELDASLKEVRIAIEENDALTGKTSEGTLVGLLFNDNIWPFLRMKSFRRLLAKKKNGRIWEKGFSLISGSKEYQKAWLDVQEIELDIEIADEEYYYGRLREIENRITHDFSLRTA